MVVEPTHLNNISQIGTLPPIGVKIPKIFEATTWFELAHQLQSDASEEASPHLVAKAGVAPI